MNSGFKSVFSFFFYKTAILLFFVTAMFLISLKAKYDNLASDYLQSANKVGRYYAFSCQQNEKELRQLLQRLVDSSVPTHWIERLYSDHLLQQRYNQIVLDSFEKEIGERKTNKVEK